MNIIDLFVLLAMLGSIAGIVLILKPTKPTKTVRRKPATYMKPLFINWVYYPRTKRTTQ